MSKLQIDLKALVESHYFGELKPLDVFRVADDIDDGPYMVFNKRDGHGDFKTIDLSNGAVLQFDSDDAIIPINVKLVNGDV